MPVPSPSETQGSGTLTPRSIPVGVRSKPPMC